MVAATAVFPVQKWTSAAPMVPVSIDTRDCHSIVTRDCCVCRITGVKENTSRAPNCGMYSMTGYVSGGADGSVPNITVQVAGLYDVTNVLNACTVQAKDQ